MERFFKLAMLLGYIVWFMTSCAFFKTELKRSRLRRANEFFTYSDYSTGTLSAKSYKSSSSVKVKLREDPDGLFIMVEDSNEIQGVGTEGANDKVCYNAPAQNNPFFSLSASKRAQKPPYFFFNASDAKSFFGYTGKGIRYKQWRPYIQALTIAAKFRNKIDGESNKLPSVPSQIEIGSSVASIALAGGFKHSWSKYTGSKNALGFSTISHSLSSGFLVGLSSADLKTATTRGQIPSVPTGALFGTTYESKNLTIPIGAHFVYGYNNINIGFAVGQDILTGPNRKDWNYFGRWWKAVVIGIDIIK